MFMISLSNPSQCLEAKAMYSPSAAHFSASKEAPSQLRGHPNTEQLPLPQPGSPRDHLLPGDLPRWVPQKLEGVEGSADTEANTLLTAGRAGA